MGVLYVFFGIVVVYGWIVKMKLLLVGIEIVFFFLGVFFVGVINGFNVFVINIYFDSLVMVVVVSKLVWCVVVVGVSVVVMFIIE